MNRMPSNKTALAAGFAAATLLAASVAGAQPLRVQKFPYKSGPVTITSCTVNEDKSNSTVSPKSLRINYFPNVPGAALTSITFRVRYAGTPVTITDTGNFAYQAPITHQFDQLGGLAWAGASPEVCRVVTATFADGRVVNPRYDGPDGMRAPLPVDRQAPMQETMPESPPPPAAGQTPVAPQPPAPPAPAATPT